MSVFYSNVRVVLCSMPKGSSLTWTFVGFYTLQGWLMALPGMTIMMESRVIANGDPALASSFSAIYVVGWYFKPLYGLITDLCEARARRNSVSKGVTFSILFLFFGACITMVGVTIVIASLVVLNTNPVSNQSQASGSEFGHDATMNFEQATSFVIGNIMGNVGAAIQDVIVDGFLARWIKQLDHRDAGLIGVTESGQWVQSAVWTGRFSGAAVGTVIGAVMYQRNGAHTTFMLMFASVTVGLFFPAFFQCTPHRLHVAGMCNTTTVSKLKTEKNIKTLVPTDSELESKEESPTKDSVDDNVEQNDCQEPKNRPPTEEEWQAEQTVVRFPNEDRHRLVPQRAAKCHTPSKQTTYASEKSRFTVVEMTNESVAHNNEVETNEDSSQTWDTVALKPAASAPSMSQTERLRLLSRADEKTRRKQLRTKKKQSLGFVKSNADYFRMIAYMFLSGVSPSVSGVFVYYIIDNTALDVETLGFLGAVDMAFLAIGTALYSCANLDRVSTCALLYSAVAIGFVLSITEIAAIHDTAVVSAWDNKTFCIFFFGGLSSLGSIMGGILTPPVQHIASVVTPKNAETLAFSIMMALSNLSGGVSTALGAWVASQFGVAKDSYGSLQMLLLCTHVASAAIACVTIPLVPFHRGGSSTAKEYRTIECVDETSSSSDSDSYVDATEEKSTVVPAGRE